METLEVGAANQKRVQKEMQEVNEQLLQRYLNFNYACWWIVFFVLLLAIIAFVCWWIVRYLQCCNRDCPTPCRKNTSCCP